MLFQVYGENALYQWLGWAMVFIGLILINEVARRSKIGGTRLLHRACPLALTAYFVAIYVGAGMGADWALEQPHVPAHEQLVPLRKALRGHHRLHRLHGAQVQVGQDRQVALVQVLPVRHRGHQHPHRRGERLRKRHSRLGHHLGVLRGRHALRRLAQRVQRRGRPHQHRLHDRLVRHLRFQEEAGHAVARHDVGVHPGLRPVELLLHLQLPAHALVATAAWRCCWPPPWRPCSGTRAAGFRTARSRWPSGACSRRCSPCSRTTACSASSR